MNIYSFKDIEAAGDCAEFAARELGIPVSGGRCAARWRGGDGQNVTISKCEWYDHKEKAGGGIVQLCAVAKFGGDIQRAQDFLGEYYHLTPKRLGKPRRATMGRREWLERNGYALVRQYDYRDESGEVVHSTLRYEKQGAKKEFVQCTPYAPTLEGVRTVIYNLGEVLKSPSVCIAEGEKDAETLTSLGFVGTTVPMGAGKWQDYYTPWFADKEVVIFRDRDEAGEGHANMVAAKVSPVAKSVRIVCPGVASKDVTEWVETEGGNAVAAREIIASARALTPPEIAAGEEAAMVQAAKDANRFAFRNYRVEKRENDKGRDESVIVPIQIGDMMHDLETRLLGFPRRLGETLFDHDRDTGEINILSTQQALLAWISLKTKHNYEWRERAPFVSRGELFDALLMSVRRYDGLGKTPDYPLREDVYYTYGKMPPPSEGHVVYEKFLSFFNPSTPAARLLLRSFFAAPVYYRREAQRPCWTIDSIDGAGVGKTTLVEILALLYDCEPIRSSQEEMERHHDEVVKNLLSAGGRMSKIFLLDNVTGAFRSSRFADDVTAVSFSGRSAYGHGGETRANNITFCITANNALINEDIASRSIMLLMSRPKIEAGESWRSTVFAFVRENRLRILADIIDIVRRGAGFSAKPQTRFPEFEREIIMPMCGIEDEYEKAMAWLTAQKDEANIEYELARQAQETIEFSLKEILDATYAAGNAPAPSQVVAFIRNEAIAAWFSGQRGSSQIDRSALKGFAKSEKIPQIAKDEHFFRYPYNHPRSGMPRAAGLMWFGEHVTEDSFVGVYIIGNVKRGELGIANIANLNEFRDEYILAEIARRRGLLVDAEEPSAPQPPPARPALADSAAPVLPLVEDDDPTGNAAYGLPGEF